jgi:hypothetical protein
MLVTPKHVGGKIHGELLCDGHLGALLVPHDKYVKLLTLLNLSTLSIC